MAAANLIENRTFDEIAVGDTASLTRTLTADDIQLFAAVSGDVNPAHLDPVYAETDMFHRVIAHGMWGAGLISAILGTELPGPGAIYLGQSLRFTRPVGVGDTITACVTVAQKRAGQGAHRESQPAPHAASRRADRQPRPLPPVDGARQGRICVRHGRGPSVQRRRHARSG